jgi:hypothetical protein
MELDSVRSLKLQLAAQMEEKLAPKTPRAFRLGTGRMSRRSTPESSLFRNVALGVSQGSRRGDFYLAVRLVGDDMETLNFADEFLRKAARDEVDVRHVGNAYPLAAMPDMSRYRPLKPGSSVSHYAVTAGTIGCFPKHKATGKRVLLSNNHVLANTNAASVDDAILQPGAADGGMMPKDQVGSLLDFVRLKYGERNFVDAAIASINEEYEGNGWLASGAPSCRLRSTLLDLDDIVTKLGRTTLKTKGRIVSFEVNNFPFRYGPGPQGIFRFWNLIEIEGLGLDPFSRPGDSGSIVLDDNEHGVGLVFGGTERGGSNGQGLSYANDLKEVFRQLGLE